jgi:hypothetical protein
LRRLAAAKPKKEKGSMLTKCMWKNNRAHDGAYLSTAVADRRSHASVPIPRNYDIGCNGGKEIVGPSGKYCLSYDGLSVQITYHNLYVAVSWGVSNIDGYKHVDRVSRELADQVLKKLNG